MSGQCVRWTQGTYHLFLLSSLFQFGFLYVTQRLWKIRFLHFFFSWDELKTEFMSLFLIIRILIMSPNICQTQISVFVYKQTHKQEIRQTALIDWRKNVSIFSFFVFLRSFYDDVHYSIELVELWRLYSLLLCVRQPDGSATRRIILLFSFFFFLLFSRFVNDLCIIFFLLFICCYIADTWLWNYTTKYNINF